MTPKTHIPQFTLEELQRFSILELTMQLLMHEDRVPKVLFEECVARGAEFCEALRPFADIDEAKKSLGHWWMSLHAMMILCRINDSAAEDVIGDYLDYFSRYGDDTPLEWLDGFWPALLRNKSPDFFDALQQRCDSPETEPFFSHSLTTALLDHSFRQGETALNQRLDWVASKARDPALNQISRLLFGDLLLDYPRASDLDLLQQMADEQKGPIKHFDHSSIERAFTHGRKPHKPRFDNPWSFYQFESIKQRTQRWSDESDEKPAQSPTSSQTKPAQAAKKSGPKIGRNDPCPCGSGKKYKKCCLR